MATKNQSPRKLKNFQGLWSFSEWFSVLFQVGVHGFFQHSAYGVTVFGNHLFGVGGIVSVDLAAQNTAVCFFPVIAPFLLFFGQWHCLTS
nr:MAG TPA: hypothetical protein [Caudoviricetes sp.]DAR96474.1 MAG TPA: hypothetical protein [Caudoviricetes sp.]